ncbi:alpha/beta hydrolase-fold protein [Rhodoferax sp. BLA1]|uniref:alpha/beta hydrolase n=1 Tax=Rhodoferax sp. BLA1 TaxID=2576062 RepID=UPI0015D34482
MQSRLGNPAGLNLPFVQVHEFLDPATGERRELFLSEAKSTAGAAARLLVLLDGNLSAVPAALMQHARMERGLGNPPPCTVVGVGYPDVQFYDRARRTRDYLPPMPMGLDTSAWQGGRADTFAHFLDASLLPWLEARQGAAFSEVGLFGHSYGGLFALHKLLHQPGRFDAFFSISPSLWWADGWLLDQLPGAVGRCTGRTLFLGIGADERAMPGDDAQRQALHQERNLQARFARLVAELQAQHLCFTAETFAGEDHGSVLYPAISRAVRWLMRPAPGDQHNTDQHQDITRP